MGKSYALGAASFVLALLAGACDTEQDCPAGHEQCVCTAEFTCLEGLACLSDRCVDLQGDDADGTGNANGSNGTNGDNDAVVACQAFIDGLQCAAPEGPALIECSVYEGLACDVGPYFDCLAENSTCGSDDTLDISGWGECVELIPDEETCTE